MTDLPPALKHELQNGTKKEVLVTIDASVIEISLHGAQEPHAELAAAVDTKHFDEKIVHNAAMARSTGEQCCLWIKMDLNDKIIPADPQEKKREMRPEVLAEIDEALLDQDVNLGVMLLPPQPNISPTSRMSRAHATVTATPSLPSSEAQLNISDLDARIRREKRKQPTVPSAEWTRDNISKRLRRTDSDENEQSGGRMSDLKGALPSSSKSHASKAGQDLGEASRAGR
jgi:hypothetical protein